MTYVETPVGGWDALAADRAPGNPADPGGHAVADAVGEPIDPARARPVLRTGIEVSERVDRRGTGYVMLRSPATDGDAHYLRLAPEEWQLAQEMDGNATVARLVAEFARIAGRLAPGQVRRVVADLAGHHMLDELPAEAFHDGPDEARPPRVGRTMRGVTGGRALAVVGVDGLVSTLYRAGGRLLFGRVPAIAMSLVAVLGLGIFAATWWRGSQSVFLVGGSYVAGAAVLLASSVFALTCQQLGRALAVKHAGREVAVGGLTVSAGLPSAFVDTADVWMAGRRARMVAAAAGTVTGLVLAGALQLAGLAVPALGALAFKLAFVWYLHALFHLSPFLGLDGCQLLTEWLEIPHLRARALAWVGDRVRRRGQRFAALDREGRLIALYGLLAVLWSAIAANAAYRVVDDRVSGLATALWHGGAAARVLLVAVVVGLCAPLVRPVVGTAVRLWRRCRAGLAERRREADAPRRLTALRASDLRGLPEPALASLASRARWMHPPTGRQVVVAGDPQAAVYVVVDGALQARSPGDPAGTIRHHVGPGGVVGLGDALTGRAAELDWHTAGTTLLMLPTAAVATVIGALPGPPPGDRAEAEALFADTPALAGMAGDERLALIAGAHPVDLNAGAPVSLTGPTHAVVVESGVIALPDGVELRRGTLVGPVGDGNPGMVAQARTPVRLWVIPDASSLPPLVGAVTAADGPPLRASTRAPHGYPPLAAPPGPPPDGVDPASDHRLERRLWSLAVLGLLVTVMFVGVNALPGPAWAEMSPDRVLLSIDRGDVTLQADGRPLRLGPGDRRHIAAGTTIAVADGSTGRLTFRGGGAAVLCAGTRATMGQLSTTAGGDPAPGGALTLTGGRLVADTTAGSGAFGPLTLLVRRPTGDVQSTGPAAFTVGSDAVAVRTGRVLVGGVPTAPGGADLSCGAGAPVVVPDDEATASPSGPPATSGPPEPAPEPASPSSSPSPTASPTTTAPRQRTRAPTTAATPTTPAPTATPPAATPTVAPTFVPPVPTAPQVTTKPALPTTTAPPPPPPPPPTTEPPDPPDPTTVPPTDDTDPTGAAASALPESSPSVVLAALRR